MVNPISNPQNLYSNFSASSNPNVEHNSNFALVQTNSSIENNSNSMIDQSQIHKELAQYSLENENLKIIWSGDISKNNKERLGVIAYILRGDCENILDMNNGLNIEHRTNYEDVGKKRQKGLIVFTPQNETQSKMFDSYINYFTERRKAGIAYLKNSGDLIYILAPSEFSKNFYQNPKKHLLGVVCEKKDGQNKTNENNNILFFSQPPPVVSQEEKKLLLKK